MSRYLNTEIILEVSKVCQYNFNSKSSLTLAQLQSSVLQFELETVGEREFEPPQSCVWLTPIPFKLLYYQLIIADFFLEVNNNIGDDNLINWLMNMK